MPDMMEIYKKYAKNYDELIDAEDFKKNLDGFLHKEIDWENKTVYEAGIGTGRVTKIYIEKIKYIYGFDRELHMLNRCKKNLKDYLHKIHLDKAENTDLKIISEKVDIFIEGWSLGHTINENPENFKIIFKNIYNRIKKNVKNNGLIIFIETLGTNVKEPKESLVLGEFYKHIEQEYQFKRHVISTDYQFSNTKEAARIMSFFFGDEITDNFEKDQTIIPEFTGVWIKQN
jgi:SAM-dependent methyltransferase